ncbi:ImmA/IrrE family metallo-endopeptidase [Cognatiluteimonas weifangensis]|uniref:ImmA/IrrE family metallo-endopeptidase n=1 Tax=Cognatiluteimonas weifangensis TaxID=2303539 RepID=A0A372DIK1_9GAMM|nr:ImmA/IrrE family metallo-endopeptidase [Luteimonas weifangensis]RFP59349.1 ImmA/IrrE family metallo-endopeptidase [Luteimonas weifangensis]
MDDFTAEQRARKFVQSVTLASAPVPLEPYLAHIGAKVTADDDLAEGEAGYTMTAKGRHTIVVNGNDSERRQRFTICHEIGHVVLELESEHDDPSWSYERRPPNEICCDIFAAELLLPVSLFRPALLKREIDAQSMTDLAEQFNASLFATGSRMVAFSSEPCAFVVSQGGKIKYVFRSSPLRDAKLWVPSGIMLPDRSLSAALRKEATSAGPIELDADEWFDDVEGGVVLEDAIYNASRDQMLTLLRLDIEDMPEKAESSIYSRQEDDEGLKELDGYLPWPSKR